MSFRPKPKQFGLGLPPTRVFNCVAARMLQTSFTVPQLSLWGKPDTGNDMDGTMMAIV